MSTDEPSHSAPSGGPSRLDRELIEMLNELRVVQGGILLLVGFLLVIAFSARFQEVTDFQKAVYYLTLLVTGVAAVIIVAPVAHHRLAFRRHDKESVVVRGNAYVLAALVLVGVSVLGITVLVTDLLFSYVLTAVVAGLYTCLVVLLWFVLPLSSIRRANRPGA